MSNYLDGIGDVLNEFAAEVRKELQNNTSWTENLKNNINVTVENEGINISMPLYGLFIDSGRKPNSKMPPPKSLYNWLEKKGIPLEAAYNIARSIGKKGIPAKPFIEKSINTDKLAEDIANLIANNIIKEIQEKYE